MGHAVVQAAAVSSTSGLGKARLHSTMLLRYSPAPVVMMLAIHSLGPRAKTTTSSRKASHRLIIDRRRMPLSMPESTLTSATAVIRMMMIDCTVAFEGMPKTWLSPPLIWRVPRPSEVARPKIVPKMARMSTTFPGQPKARSPRRG